MGLWSVGGCEMGSGAAPPPPVDYRYFQYVCATVNAGSNIGGTVVRGSKPTSNSLTQINTATFAAMYDGGEVLWSRGSVNRGDFFPTITLYGHDTSGGGTTATEYTADMTFSSGSFFLPYPTKPYWSIRIWIPWTSAVETQHTMNLPVQIDVENYGSVGVDTLVISDSYVYSFPSA